MILSIHPNDKCCFNCDGCYLKSDIVNGIEKKNNKFFLDAILDFSNKNYDDKRIALILNYLKDNEENFELINLVRKICKEKNMKFEITCNYELLKNSNEYDFDLVSFSFNDYVLNNKYDDFIYVCDKYNKNTNLNINFVLFNEIQKNINKKIMYDLQLVSNTIYILSKKPINNIEKDIKNISEIYKYIMPWYGLDNIIIDSCLKYHLGLSRDCDKDNSIVMNPYGNIKYCPYTNILKEQTNCSKCIFGK